MNEKSINNRTPYDIGIIGAGIAGLNAAMYADKNGLRVIIFEKRDLGGLSLNGGDLLIAELFAALKYYKKARNYVNNDQALLTFDLQKVFASTKNIKENYLHFFLRDLKTSDAITFIPYEAVIQDKTTIVANEIAYHVHKIILASGSNVRPFTLKTSTNPKELPNYLNPHEIMTLKTLPNNVVIVGGGNLAFEIATFFAEAGVNTTVLAREDVLTSLDDDIKNAYLNAIKKPHFSILTHAVVYDLTSSNVSYIQDDTKMTIPADLFIPAIGFEVLKVKVGDNYLHHNSDGIIVDQFCETEISGIYAIGNANNLPKFSNRALAEAYTTINHIIGREQSIKNQTYVTQITGIMEFAAYGSSEQQLIKQNIPYVKQTFLPVTAAQSENLVLTKVLINKYTHELIGLFMVGKNLSEQMNTSLIVLKDNVNIDLVSRTQILTNSFLVTKALGDFIKDLDVGVIENNLFSYFQPKFDLKTNTIIGAESLARFQIDDRFHNPLPFITNFEKRGHIYEMDLLVLEKACKFLNHLATEGILPNDFVIAVNMSPFTISQVSTDKIKEILNKYNVDPEHLIIEITERSFETDINFIEPLYNLKALGFKISIDDFSVGHSSFALLKTFKFDEIKLDMSLLPKDEADIDQQTIYQNIVNAINLNDVRLVAEGIETAFHLNFLKRLGIHGGQGYYLGRPMDGDTFIALLKNKKGG